MEACEVALPVITLTVEITDMCTLCILLLCNSLLTQDGKDAAARLCFVQRSYKECNQPRKQIMLLAASI